MRPFRLRKKWAKSSDLAERKEPEGYYVYYPSAFSLTKNPVNSNKLEIIDVDDVVVDSLEYPNGQKKNMFQI